MHKAMHTTHGLVHDQAVDADGHILEPPDLWEDYLEPEYRDRALRIVLDERGLEELEIGGRRSQLSRRGMPSTLGAMGDPHLGSIQRDPSRTYLGEAPFGSMDPAERIKVLDAGVNAIIELAKQYDLYGNTAARTRVSSATARVESVRRVKPDVDARDNADAAEIDRDAF